MRLAPNFLFIRRRVHRAATRTSILRLGSCETFRRPTTLGEKPPGSWFASVGHEYHGLMRERGFWDDEERQNDLNRCNFGSIRMEVADFPFFGWGGKCKRRKAAKTGCTQGWRSMDARINGYIHCFGYNLHQNMLVLLFTICLIFKVVGRRIHIIILSKKRPFR